MIYNKGDILQKEKMIDIQVEGMIGDLVLISRLRPNGKEGGTPFHIDELKDWKKKGERWKPEIGEKYFFIYGGDHDIIETTWEDYGADKERWNIGNYFRTQEEAEAAAEKSKALLLSLHE